MKPQTPGLILAYLLIPVGVAIVFASMGLMMVMKAYSDDMSTLNVLLGIGVGIIIAMVPLTVSYKRVRRGLLGRFWRILLGVIGALLLAFGGYILLVEEVKVAVLLVVPLALGVLYLAAEPALLARGVADTADTP